MAACKLDYGIAPVMIPYTPGADVVDGQIILVGDTIRIALAAIASGRLDALCASGAVFKEAPKASGDGGWADGAKLYWHNGNSVLQTSATGAKPAGFAVGAAADGATTCGFLLQPY